MSRHLDPADIYLRIGEPLEAAIALMNGALSTEPPLFVSWDRHNNIESLEASGRPFLQIVVRYVQKAYRASCEGADEIVPCAFQRRADDVRLTLCRVSLMCLALRAKSLPAELFVSDALYLIREDLENARAQLGDDPHEGIGRRITPSPSSAPIEAPSPREAIEKLLRDLNGRR